MSANFDDSDPTDWPGRSPDRYAVHGIDLSRFQTAVDMTRSKLHHIVDSNRCLDELPIVANLDFGHTDPLLTIPVGGHAWLAASPENCSFEIE